MVAGDPLTPALKGDNMAKLTKLVDVFGSLQRMEISPKAELRINDVEYVCTDEDLDVDVYQSADGNLKGFTNNKKLLDIIK